MAAKNLRMVFANTGHGLISTGSGSARPAIG